MNTKLYVLGAVLGAAPGLLPVVSAPPVAPSQESRQDSRGTSRKGRGGAAGAPGNHAVVAPPPPAEDAPKQDASVPNEGRTRGGGELEAPRHPCEAITIIQVPCDAAQESCEYTYWHCPEAVNPLRA
ncbi:hypothetical protein A176_000551 [Myxococcus hansupus]|uniref:Uncharacterized protein n=1 Tax=Pseudomyxococcus hansupus TaxID=1297742 RepID=A0A0H4WLN5_9BACT|nr:hypothetical protein [Myxococcus hansupus]AKQ63639.1 hypothetical protein A176_000551 [Myxococcus hansupus]